MRKLLPFILFLTIFSILMVFTGRVILAIVAEGAQGEKAVCQRIPALELRLREQFENREEKISEHRQLREDKITAKRAEFEQRLQQLRTQRQQKLEVRIAELEALANTDEKKAALAAFQNAISTARNTWYDAIKNAIATFRQAIDDLINDRAAAIDAARAARKTAFLGAFAKAKAECEAGIPQNIVRENLKTDLKAVQDKFQTAIKNARETAGTAHEAAVSAKKEAFKNAHDEFEAALKEARDQFQAAWKETE